MTSIQGVYDGKTIKPLEDFHVDTNVRVIITFLDAVPLAGDEAQTDRLLELGGSWQDTRSADDIVNEIYQGRTVGNRDIRL